MFLFEEHFFEQHNIQNIFLLINRWDLVLKEYEKEKICDHFTRRLSDYLSITEKEVEKMWLIKKTNCEFLREIDYLVRMLLSRHF